MNIQHRNITKNDVTLFLPSADTLKKRLLITFFQVKVKGIVTVYVGMIKQLDKYWVKLFADPIPVATTHGVSYVYPQRTNNLLEQFFQGVKQRSRKKNGTASLDKV